MKRKVAVTLVVLVNIVGAILLMAPSEPKKISNEQALNEIYKITHRASEIATIAHNLLDTSYVDQKTNALIKLGESLPDSKDWSNELWNDTFEAISNIGRKYRETLNQCLQDGFITSDARSVIISTIYSVANLEEAVSWAKHASQDKVAEHLTDFKTAFEKSLEILKILNSRGTLEDKIEKVKEVQKGKFAHPLLAVYTLPPKELIKLRNQYPCTNFFPVIFMRDYYKLDHDAEYNLVVVQ